MVGVPGPTLVIDHTVLSFQMILTIGVSVTIGAIICFFCAPLMVKITRAPAHYLFVYLMPLIVLGAYVVREFPIDTIVIGATALLGLCIKRFGFSAPAIIMGFVMGDLFERYLILSFNLHKIGMFWSSPIATVLTAVILVVIFWGPIKSLLGRARGEKVAVEGKA
jgi:putative tricarboxylic transport membrane protein